jgi:signal transduction histidine kinase
VEVTTFDRLPARLRALPPVAVDVLVVGVVGMFTGPDAAVNEPEYRQADWLTWLLLAVSLLALLWRRRWPVPVAVVTGAACAGWALHGHIGELLNLPTIVALYTVAVQGDRRRTLWTGLAAALASGVVALWVGKDVVNPQGLPVLEMLWPLVPLLLGEVVRTRRELLDEYAARAARAEADREREAARRVREERVRIARELHDVVAHTVAAMTVQAGVALETFDVRPEMARQAMRQVRDSGKGAVRELRATVTVLREPEGEDDPVEPAPGIERLGELVDRFAGGGIELTLREEGASDGVPSVVGLAAYRIVQEALTNVVKHSRARHAAVSVVRQDGRLAVEVIDDGPPSPPPEEGGFGLVGMRERAAAAGGTIDYGPVPGGGFRVRAVLPAGLPTGGNGEGR